MRLSGMFLEVFNPLRREAGEGSGAVSHDNRLLGGLNVLLKACRVSISRRPPFHPGELCICNTS